MPTNHPAYLRHYCLKLLKLQPRTILDIGIDHGTNGVLAREYCGPEYITALHWAVHDFLDIRDARTIVNDPWRFDLIVMTDIIEHITHEDGERLLTWIAGHSVSFLVTTPAKVIVNPPAENPLEEHLSIWTSKELERFGKVKPARPLWVIEER